MSICYDAWFPESTRSVAWLGAEFVVNVVKTIGADRKQERVLAQANAIVNQVFMLSVNAAGPIGTGGSIVCDPEGTVIAHKTGAVVGTAGYYLDLTATFVETRQVALDEALPDLFEARAVIEQAKGLLMAIYRVSPEQAFGVLRWRSQETNTKLRSLAKQLITENATLPPTSAETQATFDHLLLTVHQRIPSESTT